MDTFEPTGARGTTSCPLVLAAWIAGHLPGIPRWAGMAVGSLLAAALVADGIAAWRASA